MLVGIAVVALVAVFVPALRPMAMLSGLVGILGFGAVAYIRDARNHARLWRERLDASASSDPDRLELQYQGDLLEPEWPLLVEVNRATREVTVERAGGIGRKTERRTYPFEDVSHVRYARLDRDAVTLSLVLKDGMRVPLAKIDPQQGKRRPRYVALREPDRPELVLEGVDEHSLFVAKRIRELIGVGASKPLPEDLGFAEPSPRCTSCDRTVPPNQERCPYCGGKLAAASKSPTLRAGSGPIVYEIP